MRKLVFLLLFAIYVDASEVVYLKNGDRISGAVARIGNSKLVVKTQHMGEVQMDVDQVERIESDRKFTVTAIDESYSARSLNFGERTADLSISDSEAVSVPLEALQNVYSTEFQPRPVPEETFWSNWFGTVDAGMSAARGTSSTTNLSFGFNASRATERNRLRFGLTSLYAQNSTVGKTITSANAIHAATRYDLNVSDNMFTFAMANFDSDRLQNLDLRGVFGGGAGVRLRKTANTSLDFFGGASINQEYFDTEPDRRSGEVITGQELRLRFPRTELSQRLMFFPNLTAQGEYRVAFDSTALLKFNSWLGWQSTLSNIYVSNPVPGARNNDLLITTGIRFSLGAERTFQPKLKVPTFVN